MLREDGVEHGRNHLLLRLGQAGDGVELVLDHQALNSYDTAWGFTTNPAGQVSSESRDNDLIAFGNHVTGAVQYTPDGLNRIAAIAAGGAPLVPGYDANGNLTGDGATSYVYDPENRLVVATGAHQATLRYDPLGRLYEVRDDATGSIRRLLYRRDSLQLEPIDKPYHT